MRAMLIVSLALGLLVAPLTAAAQQHSVMVIVLERHNGELQTESVAKSVLAGALAKGGWTVVDANEYPLTVSGEDLNQYLLQQYPQNGGQYKSNAFSASMSPSGDIRLNANNVSSFTLTTADLRHIRWRLDLDKLQSAAHAAGARYLLYGEVSTRAVRRQDLSPGFASEGFGSALGMANLRLIDVDSRAVRSTFVDQAPTLQYQQAMADFGAAKAIAEKAGEYFIHELAVASVEPARSTTTAPPPPPADASPATHRHSY